MKADRIERSLIAVFGMAIIVVLGLPVFATPVRKAYWTLFHNSEICPLSQAWAGLSEFVLTKEESGRFAAKSRLRGVDSLGLQEWDTPFGLMWFPRGAAAWTVHFTLAQLEIGAYPGAPVRSGDIVMDCGGYVGDSTKWALQAGASKVITIEPSAEALECIRRNLAGEIRQGRVVLYPKGVWDDDGSLYLSHEEKNPASNAVTASRADGGEKIEVTTVDKVVSELKLDRLDVVKMDVEGAEVRAIRGARNTLNRFRPHLAIATEHTEDMLKNNRDVLQAIHEVAPFYRMRCGYCAPVNGILTPQTLYFSP